MTPLSILHPPPHSGLSACTTTTDAGACGRCSRCGHTYSHEHNNFTLLGEATEYVAVGGSSADNSDTVCRSCGTCATGKYRSGCRWNKSSAGECLSCQAGFFKASRGLADDTCQKCAQCELGQFIDVKCAADTNQRKFVCLFFFPSLVVRSLFVRRMLADLDY